MKRPPKLVRIDLDEQIRELVAKTDHKTLAFWACDCAERVLPFFERKYPDDNRPRLAIEVGREWSRNGIIKMADIRKAALAAHAAARKVKEEDEAARSAARAAGHAVAVAHVSTHSIGAAVYAATAARDTAETIDPDAAVSQERDWQYHHLLELQRQFENRPEWKSLSSSCIRQRCMLRRTQTIKVSKTINAPLEYVFKWCTDFSEDDPKITGSKSQRKILEKTKKRVIYAQLYKAEDGTQKVAIDIVTLKSPTSWHLDYFGEEDNETGEYKLNRLGKSKTRLDMVFKEKWKNVKKIPTRRELVKDVNAVWDKYVSALEADYGTM